MDVEADERGQLRLGLDPLGHQPAALRVGEVAQSGEQRLARGIGVDAGHERSVDLHDLGSQLDDVAKAGEAGARVVDGDLDRRTRAPRPRAGRRRSR